MKWFPLLGRVRTEKRLSAMAEEIAAHSRSTIWSRIVDATADMSRNEARGYVRARSAQVIQDAIDSYLIEHGNLVSTLRAQLVELTTNAVVAQAISELFRGRSQKSIIRTTTIPIPVPVSARRAA